MTSIKLLIVDDNQDNIEILKYKLKESGENYQISESNDGQEAIAKIDIEMPDVVLLDVIMPGMDGFEVARTIKSKYTDTFIPIIMVTAREDIISMIQGLDSGGDDYIIKPFEIGELQARIRSMKRIKELQDKIVAINKRLIETEKLAAAGATVAAINHEINNPLCAMLLDIQMILLSPETKKLSEKIVIKLNDIEKNASRIAEITKKLADIKEISTTEYVKGTEILKITTK